MTLISCQLFSQVKASPKIRRSLSSKAIKLIFKSEPTFRMRFLTTCIMRLVDAFFHWLGMMIWRTKLMIMASLKLSQHLVAMDVAAKVPSLMFYKGNRLLRTFLQSIQRQTESVLPIELQLSRRREKKPSSTCGRKKELRSLCLIAWSCLMVVWLLLQKELIQ